MDRDTILGYVRSVIRMSSYFICSIDINLLDVRSPLYICFIVVVILFFLLFFPLPSPLLILPPLLPSSVQSTNTNIMNSYFFFVFLLQCFTNPPPTSPVSYEEIFRKLVFGFSHFFLYIHHPFIRSVSFSFTFMRLHTSN